MRIDSWLKFLWFYEVCFEAKNSTRLVLIDLKDSPDIPLNLISLGKLDDEGFCNTFNDQWKAHQGCHDHGERKLLIVVLWKQSPKALLTVGVQLSCVTRDCGTKARGNDSQQESSI